MVNSAVSRPLEPEAERAIRKHLHHGGYLRHALKTFQEGGGVEADNADALAQDLLNTVQAEVDIVSMRARGGGRSPVVRVAFHIDGGPPEGEDPVQYFRMNRSLVSGWRVTRRTSALAYYLPYFLD